MRKARNLPEVLFWIQVSKHQFHGLDFDRQKIIGNYIVDFYIKAVGLIVEIDGSSHNGREEEDSAREAYLVGLGYRVLRFTTVEVLEAHGSSVEENGGLYFGTLFVANLNYPCLYWFNCPVSTTPFRMSRDTPS